jgi:hypothetical protein
MHRENTLLINQLIADPSGEKVLRVFRLKTPVKFIPEIGDRGGSGPRPPVSRATDSFGSHPSDTPGYNPFELQSSTRLPPDMPLRSIRREIEHLLKASRKDDAAGAYALGLFKTPTPSDARCHPYLSELLRPGLIEIYDSAAKITSAPLRNAPLFMRTLIYRARCLSFVTHKARPPSSLPPAYA